MKTRYKYLTKCKIEAFNKTCKIFNVILKDKKIILFPTNQKENIFKDAYSLENSYSILNLSTKIIEFRTWVEAERIIESLLSYEFLKNYLTK